MAEAGLAELSLQDFLPLLNQSFRLSADDVDVEANLIEARSLGSPTVGRRQAFSLLFCVPSQEVLPQSIYRLEHQVLGELAVFLVPVSRRESLVEYEAVFN
jgi:hypothetical protein